MNKNILDDATQKYIDANLNADVNRVVLAKSSFEKVSSVELAQQISAKKKAQKKLPTWYNTPKIYYPAPLSIEQTSSEVTAKYKSKLAKGNSLIDITGGFGVDAYYFAQETKAVTHVEYNEDLSQIAEYNASILNVKNISFYAGDGIEYLKATSKSFDTIYVDPARRADSGKVFMLKDCTPDVVSNIDLLLSKSSRIIIKTAPLLDISAGLSELRNVSEIHIVSVKNECKELLWVIDSNSYKEVKIKAVTINDTEKTFSFLQHESNISATFIESVLPQDYLYEPDAALLKSGAFNLIGEKYGLRKLHPQTQLYTSAKLNTDFPGRIFIINEIFSAKDLKKGAELIGNIIVRNYPAKPEDLAKKYKIKAGKDEFLIFTKDILGNNIILKSTILQYY